MNALAGDLAINKACNSTDPAILFAEQHVPDDESDEFLRGMASGLMLAVSLVDDGSPESSELVDLLRCAAAQAATLKTLTS
ncbi:MAG: hypothetical protein JSS66_05940 [Armatimonadetes bacterium]|nr:hypothetical protein [Armatimonadota bacterium]